MLSNQRTNAQLGGWTGQKLHCVRVWIMPLGWALPHTAQLTTGVLEVLTSAPLSELT